MPRRIELSRAALADFDEIYDYIARESPRAAAKVLRSLDESIQLLADQPKLGKVFRHRRLRLRLLTHGDPLDHGWLLYALCLYGLAGACWIPVVGLQIRVRDLARAAERDGTPLGAKYWGLARQWFWLGVPAFASIVIVFWLMVWKPA
jgi:plasmid stabilization system protein ParE